jgi:thiamine-phosphate pyrophosphorylase
MRLNVEGLALCVVTDRQAARGRSIVDVVQQAIAGGATMIQLREKIASTREMLDIGRALLTVTRPARIPLIVNDRIDVAIALGAEGVHVGQSDMPAALARQMIGPDTILGVSAEEVQHAIDAERDGADYVGAGDVFGTPTKADACAPIGAEGLSAIVRATRCPVIAIGGINFDNAADAIAAGSVGLAVISAVVSADDPAEASKRLLSIVRNRMEKR